uniref:ATP-dependent Clp protease proteolytic subunit 1 n=1 Tax=Helicteres hirsuta TaxID=1489665 RepID=UPI002E794C97|nr:ATP-dependent Clp protease proteolytic subunit 1 [Helicteres hirsuta]WPV76339.1 ATP-dependent Clp protease proteolytic subunit 1 [Helicteres hirsuta]
MPIGIPKVPFRLPGDEEATWVDLYNVLYRQRFLFLGKELNLEFGDYIIGLIIYLNIEDPRKDQYVFLNSPGGWIIPGIGIFDAMQFVKAEVQTIGLGLVASMASVVLVGGEITKRLAYPHVRIMIHQPASHFRDSKTGEFILEVGILLHLRKRITKIYAQRTGQPLRVVARDLERDDFLSAEEARVHGIVDMVAVSLKTEQQEDIYAVLRRGLRPNPGPGEEEPNSQGNSKIKETNPIGTPQLTK